MVKLIPSYDKTRNETTVKATDQHGRELCAETWIGKGVRLTLELSKQVEAAAKDMLRQQQLA